MHKCPYLMHEIGEVSVCIQRRKSEARSEVCVSWGSWDWGSAAWAHRAPSGKVGFCMHRLAPSAPFPWQDGR